MKWYRIPLLLLVIALLRPASAAPDKPPYDSTVCPGPNIHSPDCRHFNSRAKERQREAQLLIKRQHEASVLGAAIYRMTAMVLETQSKDSGSQSNQTKTIYYVSILGEDPPASFFQRLKSYANEYKPGSQFKLRDNRGSHYGMRVYFSRFQPVDDNTVRVWWNTSFSGQTSVFQRKQNGRWVLIRTKTNRIT